MADDFTRGADDYVIPFQIESSGARGRLVRMGPAITTILGQHDYPDPVSNLLGEAMTLTAMLGAALKIDGKFILQTSSEGPVRFLVAHYYAPGNIRGYASFDQEAFDAANAAHPDGGAKLLGDGHLAMTIDQGPDSERYQGIVPLEGGNITEAADLYFRQSEQLPTFIKIAVARQFEGGRDGKPGSWSWRAGGLMVQKLTSEGGAPSSNGHDADDAWLRAQLLAATVEDHELLDVSLEPERLLYRLFHEERVRAFDATPISAFCQCSRDRVEQMLTSFSPEEIEDMVEDGHVLVTCEFCNTHYDFDADTLRAKAAVIQ
ncbi:MULTISPECIES: Hsp33 family molecular chaperone [Rhodomicrobium]|uniref:Hsp33 family molecular chaperone n=1 Tax=Rhodomicrobium TaxID=1068 RepID=UPI000B4B4AB3|nr:MULTISPECIES: Hsp33 family molecular chaperone [Rhodomicrobium]